MFNSSNKKIDLVIASRFLTQPITGVQRYAIEISKTIKKLNTKYNILFVSPQNIIHNKIANILSVKKIGKFEGHLWDQISLLKFLKSNANPLVVNFSNTLPVFYKNKVITIHDIIHLKHPVSYSYRKYYEIIFPLMIKYSRHIITVSEFSKKEISTYFGISNDKISVVYNGVNEKFKPKKIKSNERYILGVSSIAYHKNFISLIEAFLRLKVKNMKLYIVGGLNEKIFGKNSKIILDSLKNNDSIKFLGRVSDEKLIELYSNAVCFVYSSLYEGFGIPPLEAQACGCPVILSDIPVFKEIYSDSAFYFNPLDFDDIATKIAKILYDDNLRTFLISKGFENAKKYTWESSAVSFLKIIEKVINND
ncbi:glycosyltransferase family 4 protein [Thermodesulfovibrio thiophilus]|uniref:glycosyltransferase family 4 protein n=1 Tax=Thermodesulfovibrio thiophilus TaxID=340095 RepID=UPI000428789A|nr:glycosyltransferase family 1 protein [Thermodesulfovibrio thiophilus]